MNPGAIGKVLQKRTRSLSASLEISKYEVESFNKCVDFDNQHMETPSKWTKLVSSMSSNEEMQKKWKKKCSWERGYANQCLIAAIYLTTTPKQKKKGMIYWIHVLLSFRI